MSAPPDLPIRDTARALVFDPAGRLFLIAYEAVRDVDPARPGLRRFWFTPGGGVEAGESHEEALRRELDEEIGRRDIDLGPWIARRETPLLLFRKERFVRERYFLVRLPDDRVDTSRLAETEDNPVIEVRWWSVPDLLATNEVIEPRSLAALAASAMAGRLPTAPEILA